MLDADIVARIRSRAGDAKLRTSNAGFVSSALAARATALDIDAAEKALGFSLPHDLSLLYRDIGNGGFGPGYGLMGTPGGSVDDQMHSMVSLYHTFAQHDLTAPLWAWPDKLLPICHWGCAIYSCVDCGDEQARMIVWDPNNWNEDEPLGAILTEESPRFSDWIGAWAAGEDLWTRLNQAISAKIGNRP